mmetsp:Transcript_46793/g.134792  ORF Transcript_46793/g.134792 Transcript_46793/m.134792 type:complete len:217 (-) Transcript_46793:610-1260(-)
MQRRHEGSCDQYASAVDLDRASKARELPILHDGEQIAEDHARNDQRAPYVRGAAPAPCVVLVADLEAQDQDVGQQQQPAGHGPSRDHAKPTAPTVYPEILELGRELPVMVRVLQHAVDDHNNGDDIQANREALCQLTEAMHSHPHRGRQLLAAQHQVNQLCHNQKVDHAAKPHGSKCTFVAFEHVQLEVIAQKNVVHDSPAEPDTADERKCHEEEA